MTAPLDIGLEQNDAALGVGQEDVFDLGEAERRMNRKAQVQWLNDEMLETSDDEDEGDRNIDEDGDEDVLSPAEERDKRVDGLEAELDGLYDAYKDRLRERDAKFKAKEERAKNKEREKEWNGIQTERGSDDENSDSADSEGGWEVAQRNKMRDSDTSADESTDDEEGESMSNRKRFRSSKDPPLPATKRQRLVEDLELLTKPSSAASRLWFSQGVFSGIEVVGALKESEEEAEGRSESNDSDDEINQELDETDQVCRCALRWI